MTYVIVSIKIEESSCIDMNPIEIEFEHALEFDEIEKALITPTTGEIENGGDNIPSEYDQTCVDGIIVPIIRLNNMTIDASQVMKFRLSCDVLPQVSVTIRDTYSLSRVLDSPKCDNKMIVQILPKGDGIYKKIQLPFYITDYSISGDKLTINAIYNVEGLYGLSFKVYGPETTTCALARDVATELKLGYATNIEDVADARHMYARGTTLMDLLKREMTYSGDAEHILDFWVDYWNNLTVVDMYDAYKNNDDEIKITIDPLPVDVYNSMNQVDLIEVDAILTNHPMVKTSLHYDDYKLIMNTSENVYQGTDKLIESYSVDTQTTTQTEVADGDVKNDIFKKYEYVGEYFGELDYLSQSKLRQSFLQKMGLKMIQITLPKVQFGLMRGTRVNVMQYECDDTVKGVINANEITDNANLSNDTGMSDAFVLNKTISGQYLIYNTEIRYKGMNGNKKWEYILTLVREEATIENYLAEE